MLDLSSFAPALKVLYSDQRVNNLVYKDHPFMAMLPKKEDFFGKTYPIPIIYGNPQGRSATFSRAKNNKGSSKLKEFSLVRKKDYSLASVDNETAEASENDKGAFLTAIKTETDGAFGSAGNSMSSALFGSGSGSIGQIAAISTTTIANDTVTLADTENIVYFEVGMFIDFSLTDGGGAGVKAGAKPEIIAVDRDAGTIQFDQDIVTVNTAAVNDYLFVDGDYDLKLSGLEAWLPTTAPTAGDNFFGVDRSADPVRLAGVRVNAAALPIEEALIKLQTRVCREGGNPDVTLVNYSRWEELQKALGSKVQYMVTTAFGNAQIGFQGIQVKTNKGFMNVIADPFMKGDKAYALTMKTWKLCSLKKAIRILQLDGNRWLRESDADANELRVGGYSQLGCNAPGWNGVATLS